MQFVDVDFQLLGDLQCLALDFQFVNQQFDQPAFLQAGSLTADLDGHPQLDPFVFGDASEIDVQDVDSIHVPLQFADEGLFVNHSLELNNACPVANGAGDFVGWHRQADVGFAVTVKNTGNGALGRKRRRGRLPCGGRTLTFNASAMKCLGSRRSVNGAAGVSATPIKCSLYGDFLGGRLDCELLPLRPFSPEGETSHCLRKPANFNPSWSKKKTGLETREIAGNSGLDQI